MQTEAAEAERLLRSTLDFEPIDSPRQSKLKLAVSHSSSSNSY